MHNGMLAMAEILVKCLCLCCCCRPRYLDEALARQFTTAVRVGKRSKEAGKTIKEVGVQGFAAQLARKSLGLASPNSNNLPSPTR